MEATEADYIIVGGGLAGCALASRIHHGKPSLRVLVIEAGTDPSGNPLVTTPMGGLALTGSELDWAYTSLPQSQTNNRVHTNNAGKVLGGGSVINYGGWSRGDPADYDEWARVVGDPRWSYAGLLPFFRRSESYFDSKADPEKHGFSGPMHVTSVLASDPNRKYGLRQAIRDAWTELGVKYNPDPSESLSGLSDYLENWRNGLRQPSTLAYGLGGVQVLTNAMVHRVVFSTVDVGQPIASAVLLADGRLIAASKEIILSAGTFRTPQILMLSGIGPAATLSKHNVSQIYDAPQVGQNLFDHFAHFQFWKIRNPEKGLAIGSPLWKDPALFKGIPCDWAVNEPIPLRILDPAVQADNQLASRSGKEHNLSLLHPSRSYVETTILYAPAGATNLPMNGNYIASSVMLCLPTSRGSVTISSASPTEPPVIDSNYYDTNADRVSLIHGTRRILEALLNTSAGKAYIESEAAPPGFLVLDTKATDTEIDARIRAAGISHKHAAGSAAMGTVLENDLRVKGVQGLRVVDASILPVPVGGHPQATLYAIAEQAAELILQSS